MFQVMALVQKRQERPEATAVHSVQARGAISRGCLSRGGKSGGGEKHTVLCRLPFAGRQQANEVEYPWLKSSQG